MASFSFPLVEGLNCISIPLILEDENARWSTILSGVAFNSVRTLVDGEWQDYIRGRSSELNDFSTAELGKGYLIDIIRIGALPVLTNPLPATLEQQKIEITQSVYVDETEALVSVPPLREGSLWLKTSNSDATDSSASFITFTTDRATNLYVAYDNSASTIPSWLNDWDATGTQVTTTNNTYDIYRLPIPAGAYSLPGNQNGGGDADNMYLVLLEENLFPVTVSSPVDYQIAQFDEGSLTYLDRLYIVTDLPEELEGADWIRTNHDDYTDSSASYLSMTFPDEGTVYVAYPDAGCPPPAWLSSFVAMDEILESSALSYRLYKKTFSAGAVVLGGASAPTSINETDYVGLGPNATPGANYLVGVRKLGPASITVTVTGDEPTDEIIDIPITGKAKGGTSLIGFPKSATGTSSIAANIDARGLKYEQIMRLRKGTWDSYVPTRDAVLNWIPADLERGLGYIVKSSINEDQTLEIEYDV